MDLYLVEFDLLSIIETDFSWLTLSQTRHFRLFQTQRDYKRHYKFDKNGGMFCRGIENTVGKEEIARYEQFLFFPQCFQKICAADT